MQLVCLFGILLPANSSPREKGGTAGLERQERKHKRMALEYVISKSYMDRSKTFDGGIQSDREVFVLVFGDDNLYVVEPHFGEYVLGMLFGVI